MSDIAVYEGLIKNFLHELNTIVFLLEENGTIVAASAAAHAFLREEIGALEGRPITDFFLSVMINAMFSRAKIKDTRNITLTAHIMSSGDDRELDASFGWTEVGDKKYLEVTCWDIGSLNATIKRLTAREDLYRTIFHDSPLGFVHIDSDGYIRDCNQMFLTIFGYIREQIIGTNVAERKMSDTLLDERFSKAAVGAVIGTGSSYEDRFAITNAMGARNGWLRVSFSPIISDNRSFLGAIGIVEDITDEKEAEEKIAYIGNHDALTGLRNRHACEVDRVLIDTDDALPIGIIYIDLNHLKLANDAFGHHEGDELLTKCASIIRANAREDDKCYRLGGDEFVMLMPHTDAEQIEARAHSMTDMCLSWSGEGLVAPSMAIGYAAKMSSAQKLDDVLKDAEDMMYANKLRDGQAVRSRLMRALESKLSVMLDGAVGRRSARMAMWCEWVIEQLPICDEKDRADLRALCRYHDIGLLGAVEDIDQIKLAPAARDEDHQMQHSVVGYRIARTIPELSPISEYILSHHERWDGRGYPSQQAGEEIPWLSRLVSIFDALEGRLTLASEGERVDIAEAWLEIIACAGTHFDPSIVERIGVALKNKMPDHCRF